jgi:hypothetical protein
MALPQRGDAPSCYRTTSSRLARLPLLPAGAAAAALQAARARSSLEQEVSTERG